MERAVAYPELLEERRVAPYLEAIAALPRLGGDLPEHGEDRSLGAMCRIAKECGIRRVPRG